MNAAKEDTFRAMVHRRDGNAPAPFGPASELLRAAWWAGAAERIGHPGMARELSARLDDLEDSA